MTYSSAIIEYMTCAALFALRVGVVGTAWAWLTPAGKTAAGRLRDHVATGTTVLFIGTMASLCSVLILAENGLYSPRNDLVFLVVVAAAGIVTGAMVARQRLLGSLKTCWPILTLLLLGTFLIMALPSQGEWVVGGWDPGTYVDEGVSVSRSGTFRPGPDAVFSELKDAEFDVFTRPIADSFTEGLPVFPIDPETRAFDLFFFRLTPAFVAVADRCGGLRFAMRIGTTLGLMGLVPLLGFLLASFRQRTVVCFSMLFLLVQPIWVYHLHIPVSECLQLFLLFCLLFFLTVRQTWFGRVAVALVLLAMTVNRLSFLPFASLLVLVLAWCDADRPDRGSVLIGRVLQITALLAGAVVDHTTAVVTAHRLRSIMPLLLLLSGALLLPAICIDLVAFREGIRERLDRLLRRALPAILCIAALVLVLSFVVELPLLADVPRNVRGIVPYFGLMLIALCVGGFVRIARSSDESRLTRGLVFFLLCVTAITFVRVEITPIYPWVTRRYLVYSVPLVALLAGYAAATPWRAGWKGTLAMYAIAGILITGVAAQSLRLARPAWQSTEYDGLSEILAEAADKIDSDDILVADHFLFGVPLRFVHGKQVLNGERLWTAESSEHIETGLGALRRFASQGKRIVFLTSTPLGMRIFPFDLRGLTRMWHSGPVTLRDIQHGLEVSGFDRRNIDHEFQLFSWQPTAGAGSIWGSELDIDVGGQAGTPYGAIDSSYILDGFYMGEVTTGERSVRWASERATVGVYVTRPTTDMRADVYFLDVHRTSEAPPADLGFSFNGKTLAHEISVSDDPDVKLATMRIPQPVVLDVTNRLTITSTPWQSGGEGRLLGVMIDRVHVYPDSGTGDIQ